MLRLEFKLEENDFLNFQLFAAENSGLVQKKKKRSWIILTAASALLTFNFAYTDNVYLAMYFGVITLGLLFFYPKYLNWKYKKHYLNFIRNNYYKRFGEAEILEIHEDHIFTKDKIGEASINLSEVQEVTETKAYFFVGISSGSSIIIPKKEVENMDALRMEFVNRGIEIVKNRYFD